MTQRSLELLNQALTLSEEERADLAASLLDSLDSSIETDAEVLWQQEVARRVTDLDSTKAKTVPWEEVQGQISELLQHGNKKR